MCVCVPAAGRAQHLLHPELRRVRAGAGDHPQGHHRHGPGPVLREPEAAGGDAPDRVAEPQQPVAQVDVAVQRRSPGSVSGTSLSFKTNVIGHKFIFERRNVNICMYRFSLFYGRFVPTSVIFI